MPARNWLGTRLQPVYESSQSAVDKRRGVREAIRCAGSRDIERVLHRMRFWLAVRIKDRVVSVPDSPSAIPGWCDNLVFQTRYERGDAGDALQRADGVLTGRVSVQRHVPVPLEPRAYVGDFDTRTGRLTMYASTQMPHTDRSLLAGTFGMASEDVHVIQPDVGGGER